MQKKIGNQHKSENTPTALTVNHAAWVIAWWEQDFTERLLDQLKAYVDYQGECVN